MTKLLFKFCNYNKPTTDPVYIAADSLADAASTHAYAAKGCKYLPDMTILGEVEIVDGPKASSFNKAFGVE